MLTIAGSDPSGGAGIAVDLTTFHALGVQGLPVVTAVTSQTESKFFSANPLSGRLLREQMRAVLEIHHEHPIDAVKIGMLGTEENVLAVYRFLLQSKIPQVVLDPVLKSSTGAILLDIKGMNVLRELLIPLATVLTPNLDEAEALTKLQVRSLETMKEAALHLHSAHNGVGAVLIKGGHLKKESLPESQGPTDILYDGQDWTEFPSKKKFSRDVHGTGCALSAALAAHLARGESLQQSVKGAKEFVIHYLQK